MMGKRALVVDDSRSSRASLAKQLADQQLEVDSAETAEQAIDYLSRTRPDVIFMDHLMPGMDGFQAMQAIKKDPRTASIPVLMYTSQEGELYLGQARALGAAGVLRKGAGDTEVRALLEELMVTERPGSGIVVTPPGESAVRAGASVAFHPPPVPAGPPVQELLEKESTVLREHVSTALDAHAALMLGELRPLLQDLQTRVQAPPMEPPKPPQSPVPWLLAVAASIAAAVFGTLLWQDRQQLVSLHAELANARSDLALLTARLVPPPPPAPVEPVLAEGEAVAEGEIAAGTAPIATSGTAVTTPAATSAPKPTVVAPVTAAPLNPAVPVAASANTGHTGAQ